MNRATPAWAAIWPRVWPGIPSLVYRPQHLRRRRVSVYQPHRLGCILLPRALLPATFSCQVQDIVCVTSDHSTQHWDTFGLHPLLHPLHPLSTL
jgi:hypothetical protein